MALERIIEALIFASDSPLGLDEIQALLVQNKTISDQTGTEEIAQALATVQEKYQTEEFAFELKQIAGGYQFLTKPEFAPYIKQALLAREQKKLSKAAMESLSIVAYRQPVTKAEIEYIRGVNSDYVVNKLLEKQLIEPAGRADLPGRPLLYRTTKYFLEHFGINDVTDLPRLQELKNDEELIAEEFKNYSANLETENAGEIASPETSSSEQAAR
jgi:segregation and condensation protein B